MAKDTGAKLTERDAEQIRRRLKEKQDEPPKGTREPDDPSPDPGDETTRRRPKGRA